MIARGFVSELIKQLSVERLNDARPAVASRADNVLYCTVYKASYVLYMSMCSMLAAVLTALLLRVSLILKHIQFVGISFSSSCRYPYSDLSWDHLEHGVHDVVVFANNFSSF